MKIKTSEMNRTGIFHRGSAALIAVLLLLTLLLAGCGKKAPEPVPTAVPYVPEPEFDRDAAVFGADVKMTDLTEYAEEFRAAGAKVSKDGPDLTFTDMNTIRNILQGKNVRMIRLTDNLKLLNIADLGLGRFGLQAQNLTEKTAGILAGMENCRSLVYYDTQNSPLPEDIPWPYLRSLTVPASQIAEWEKPLSETFPELRELVIRHDTTEMLNLSALGLPETLESIEVIGAKDSIKETPALLTALEAKNIPSIRFINGRTADRFDPSLTEEQKAEYERNLYLTEIIAKVKEENAADKGKIVRNKKPRISALQLPDGAKIMCIKEKDLSPCAYSGDNEKILAALTDDPRESDVFFILSSAYVVDPNVRVISGSGSSGSASPVHSLTAVDIASGDIYYDTLYFTPYYGSVSKEQQKNNALFEEKGVWGFIEAVF